MAVSGRTGRNVATGISATNATVLTTGNISDTGKLLFARANGNGTVSASWQSNQTYNGYLGIYKVNFA